jgi:hypothetical protein
MRRSGHCNARASGRPSTKLERQLEHVRGALTPAEHLARVRDLAAFAGPLDWLPQAAFADDLPQIGLAGLVDELPLRVAVTAVEDTEQQQRGAAVIAYVEQLQMRAWDRMGEDEEPGPREEVRAATPEEIESSRAFEAREAKRSVPWMAPVMRGSRPHRRRLGTRPQRAARGRRARARRSGTADDDDGEPEPPSGPAGRRFEAWPLNAPATSGEPSGRPPLSIPGERALACDPGRCLLHDEGELVAPHGPVSPAESAT